MRRFWTLVAVAVLSGCADDGATGPDPTTDPPPQADPAVVEFADLVNQHRLSEGCGALTWHAGVAAVAQAHSEDMVARGYFSHTNPDGDSPGDRLRDAAISFTGWAENIAAGYPGAESVLAAWLNSSGHRANIENCSLTHHGVGLEGTHWTHVFLRP
jgi:uncharacterized protein YkwD